MAAQIESDGGVITKIPIDKIKVNPGRREVKPEDVRILSESMAEVGLLHPIPVTTDYTLIAGLHRLESAKLLGWAEIACTVFDMDDLHTQMAEIDENIYRTGLSDLAMSELLARRKRLYETMHPTSIARNKPGHASNYQSSDDKLPSEVKSFAQDTAEKLGVSKRTVERCVQIAENLTPMAKQLLRQSSRKISQTNLLKLSKLRPAQQNEAAMKLSDGQIDSVDEYLDEIETEKPHLFYYATGTYYIDTFAEHAIRFLTVPNNHRERLEHYRSKFSLEDLKKLEGIAEDSMEKLQDYIDLLHQEQKRCLEQSSDSKESDTIPAG